MAGTVAGAILHSVLPSKDIKGESSGYLVIIDFFQSYAIALMLQDFLQANFMALVCQGSHEDST